MRKQPCVRKKIPALRPRLPRCSAIGDLSNVWLVGNVREADAALVALGDPVEVRVPAYPQMVLHATVGYIAPVIDPSTHQAGDRR